MINIINETRYTFSGQPIPGTEEPQVSKIDIENSSLSELETELEKVSKAEFMLQMNDHWSSDDYILDRKYNQYIDLLAYHSSKLIKPTFYFVNQPIDALVCPFNK